MQLFEERLYDRVLLFHLCKEVFAFIWRTPGFSAFDNAVMLACLTALAHVLARRKSAFHLETLAVGTCTGESIRTGHVRTNDHIIVIIRICFRLLTLALFRFTLCALAHLFWARLEGDRTGRGVG